MSKGYIYIVLAAFLYSTQEISGRFLASSGKMDPIQVTFIVFTIGTIILAPLAFKEMKTKQLKLNVKDWGYFALNGLLCVPISMLSLQFAVTYTKASTSAVIFCSNAIFTIPFAYLILKEKIRKPALLSMIISLIGVIVIFSPASVAAGMTGGKDLIGVTYALIAAVAWSLFGVVSKKKIGYYGAYVLNFCAFLVGIIVLFAIIIITKRPIFTGITGNNIMILLYMGIFIKAGAYIFFLGATKMTTAVTTSMVFLIKPALATILSVILLGEKISTNTIIGIVFIIIGSTISFTNGRKAEKLRAAQVAAANK